jgi:hypothetical protein
MAPAPKITYRLFPGSFLWYIFTRDLAMVDHQGPEESKGSVHLATWKNPLRNML